MRSLKAIFFSTLFIFGMMDGFAQNLPAQSVPKEIISIAKKRKWQPRPQPTSVDYRFVQGWVLNAWNHEPFASAELYLVRGETSIAYSQSDEQGYFCFRVPSDLEHSESLQILIDQGGLSSVAAPVVLESDVLAIVVEVEVLLPEVRLWETEPRYERTICSGPSGPWGCGGSGYGTRCVTHCLVGTYWETGGVLYRPLEEWLMMHSSEIQHTGRW